MNLTIGTWSILLVVSSAPVKQAGTRTGGEELGVSVCAFARVCARTQSRRRSRGQHDAVMTRLLWLKSDQSMASLIGNCIDFTDSVVPTQLEPRLRYPHNPNYVCSIHTTRSTSAVSTQPELRLQRPHNPNSVSSIYTTRSMSAIST